MAVSKTELGAQVVKDRSVSLSSQQRSALILCDGKRSQQDVLNMSDAVGVTMQDILSLASLGLVVLDASNEAKLLAAAPAAVAIAQGGSATDMDFSTALNVAITLCSSMGFKGFSLNMGLTGVDSLEKLQKIAPEIRRVAGDAKYQPLHLLIFGKPL